MSIASATLVQVTADDQIASFCRELRAGLGAGTLAPYLGPGILHGSAAAPASYESLAAFFGSRVALPKRARGNLWASAQYVESQKHRSTAVALMEEAFADGEKPTAFQRWLSTLPLPLIVDSWYDASMRGALKGRTDWIEVQGGSRAAVGEARWYRAYDPRGTEVATASAETAVTVLYRPHGAVAPAKNFLVSDADYVEVLTEIDIQTPIPEVVQRRRSGLGFVFLGCRFHDQTMRIFARQISKRAKGPHYAVVDPEVGVTRNERRMLDDLGARVVVAPTARVLDELLK